MSGLRIYRNHADRMVLALTIVLDPNGRASFVPGEEHSEAALSMVSEGVFSFQQRRSFTPDDGEDYLDAICEMLSRSSYWRPVPDLDQAQKPVKDSRAKGRAKPGKGPGPGRT